MPPVNVEAIADYRKHFEMAQTNDWRPKLIQKDNDDHSSKTLQATLNVLGEKRSPNDFLNHLGIENLELNSLEQILDAYTVSLRQDMSDCLTVEQNSIFAFVAISFLRVGEFNACCVKKTCDGRNDLDHPIIFINQGMYFALQQIFTALILEEMQGDLQQYQKCGSKAYFAASQLVIEPASKNIGRVDFEIDDPEALGEAQAYLSQASTLVMRFIALHEFGHAWCRHFENQNDARLCLLGLKSHEKMKEKHDQEFEADAFAFKALMTRNVEPITHWANLFAIELFLLFVYSLEERGFLAASQSHPSPQDRISRLREIIADRFGAETEPNDLKDKARTLIEKWKERHLEA